MTTIEALTLAINYLAGEARRTRYNLIAFEAGASDCMSEAVYCQACEQAAGLLRALLLTIKEGGG